jgi:fructose/tagatose bisphosphate aldolase
MQLLRDILEHAQKNRVAIGHFNVADLVLLKAVFSSAQELNVPVLVGASADERAFMEVKRFVLWCEVFGKNSTSRFSSTQTIPTPPRTR